jgi:hypothetical protein
LEEQAERLLDLRKKELDEPQDTSYVQAKKNGGTRVGGYRPL